MPPFPSTARRLRAPVHTGALLPVHPKHFRSPAPVTYIVPGETTSPKFGAAFAKGCRGVCASPVTGLRPGAFAAFCTPATWGLLQEAQRQQRDWYYGDHAFFKRGKYYRITKNAYQYIPTAEHLRTAMPDRYKQVSPPVQDWQRQGSHIVICPNSHEYMRFHGEDAQQWVLDCVRQLATVTDRPIVVRWKAHAGRRPFYLDLHDAWAVVVYNSNCAVDALIAGVPIVVRCPWASTIHMGLTDLAEIESPIYPDNRESFLYALAEQQWSLTEIAAGYAWKALQ